MRVLVTGDAGKLGNLVARMLAAKHTVIGLDIKRGAQEDLFRREALHEKAKGCDCVVHAAGFPFPDLGSFGEYFWVNVMGTLRVLKAAVAQKVRRVVFCSSTAYYGCGVKDKMTPLYFPLDEQHPAGTGSRLTGGYESYDLSKIMAECVLSYYSTNRMIETIALRIAPANTKKKQYPPGFTWRTDQTYRRGSFFTNCHPEFAAQAIVRAAELPGQHWNEVFNIADQFTHESIDLREFLAREYPGVEIRGSLDHNSLISVEKAKTVLGFQPCEDLR